MGTPRHPLNSLLPAVLAGLLLAVVPAPAVARPVASVSIPASAQSARQYWTPARMRSAVPLTPSTGLRHGLVGAAGRDEGASARRHPSRPPSRGAGASSVAETIADPAALGSSQNGAIFILARNGLRGRCSGTAVNAPNLSLVVTAGHCVHFFGHWLSGKWVFVPGYRYGERPFGTFSAKWLGTTEQWRRGENSNFDVGMAVVSRNERGQRLADAVGGYGIAWGLSRQQVFDVYGYPVEEPFDGATLQRCPQTPYLGHDFLSFLFPGPLDLGVECNVTPGSSGGGWLIDGDTLNSVTSSGYPDDPLTTFGPYFGKEIGRLFKQAGRVR